jgi:ribonuclease Z
VDNSGTSVILTGTGIPLPMPGRAGAGTLVRRGEIALQFDAGRGTVIRLTEAGTPPHALTAQFITHVHSDHLVDLADVAMTRWIQQLVRPSGPLPVIAAEGGAAKFARRMFETYEDDIASRVGHVQTAPPSIELSIFEPRRTPVEVWRSADGAVLVEAVAVHHEPVREAVAYRVTTPDGVVVISGDTRVCEEVESLAVGADALVHEACRATALRDLVKGTPVETIFSYHADTVPLGALAQRAGVKHLVLTHLIPQPNNELDEAAFAQDVRAGGYTGRVTVGRDLMRVDLGQEVTR